MQPDSQAAVEGRQDEHSAVGAEVLATRNLLAVVTCPRHSCREQVGLAEEVTLTWRRKERMRLESEALHTGGRGLHPTRVLGPGEVRAQSCVLQQTPGDGEGARSRGRGRNSRELPKVTDGDTTLKICCESAEQAQGLALETTVAAPPSQARTWSLHPRGLVKVQAA